MSSSQRTLRDVMMQEERPTTMASRLLAPDASLSNPSFRNYYGVASAGSVPFLWESAPGTPKNDGVSSRALPPITPPPSYYTKTKIAKSESSKKLLSSSKPASFVPTMFRRSHTMPSPTASKECSRRKRLVASPPRSSFSSTSRGEDEEADGGAGSPTSTLCFRARRSGGGTGRLHGMIASVVGR
ncbi:uncharacterized protein LOC123440531 [Hordeum vulgare subsp. vulgare]|uniref:Predicted protein n=1 Tax=Hordeum vulgare subsp. vulgare TaxID=112509 RepID=F2DVP2_HORVV|nr:uncharacterized protein LOC123440531 [Hordeum vulgare subsp. vulgare]KAI5003819.1 hypothetical protein ZWY2020_030979 [Hordeum vulgare]BAJ99163.1 predicted protein [Hordeum vulgare subsp. vulgare]